MGRLNLYMGVARIESSHARYHPQIGVRCTGPPHRSHQKIPKIKGFLLDVCTAKSNKKIKSLCLSALAQRYTGMYLVADPKAAEQQLRNPKVMRPLLKVGYY